ncbi:CD225/dispanin family protein [Knoellia locipacati]|uniref:CD225/dispanin family protein n=1 Tax=Knoellia locipacati TaxID=882824 RepID=UPI00384AF7AC
MSDYGSTPPPPPPGGGGSTPPPPPGGGGYDGGSYGAPPPAGGYGGAPAGPPPSNNLVMAILGLLCCWPLGIPAVVFAAQVNGKWNAGDQAGAIESAAKAKKFATIALVLGVIATIFYIVLIMTGVMSSDTTTTGM